MSEASAAQSPWQTARIVRIEKRTPRVTSFFFKLSRPFLHLAGQHVDVRLTAPDGYQARRSYSIASAPESAGTVELAIERLEDGEVSPFFHEVAAVGDEIELRGPLGGHFIWSAGDGGPILLVGGGSGVVPLMAMVRHRSVRKSAAPVALVFSARVWDEVIFRDELIGLDDRRDGFDLVLTLTREPAQRASDYSRRIDAAMMVQAMERLPKPPILAFVCGSNAFVSAAAQALIDADVPAGLIRTERYGV
ncbi:MAG: oxidoreductase [Mesorhizobium sp.]|uniref:ferredoxin reductase n=5 Tax=Mesorhizobium TaxID=68287 RepID=UPI000F750A5B|nr:MULTISPECIES: ferredoxin reductase [unclassified Mesorhizobium]AZO49479.1 oxidoreductase [Mesorhizobium sp. M4B.F.Ca.ET.058.02.1.1]RUX44567.1 oxidoreductase [Mesorhizobium sp. M4A.F.Ca.ET.050.02.1.1]RVC40346.1 oxidoreductase [Mesorhizobium sp. M4A.F.Ca.ET.090.04.2.1]RVC77188.1 oxidoreductase [Mesorhizobium sp. M4A.F.Ca.ET.022.05.2.1]RWD05037.1 MAG: oxidoreductase [Mesorhizobium sp.]